LLPDVTAPLEKQILEQPFKGSATLDLYKEWMKLVLVITPSTPCHWRSKDNKSHRAHVWDSRRDRGSQEGKKHSGQELGKEG